MSAYLYLLLKDNQPVRFRMVGDSNATNYKTTFMLGPFTSESSGSSFDENQRNLTKKFECGELDHCTYGDWNVGKLRTQYGTN